MKMKALGTAPGRPAISVPPEQPAPQHPPTAYGIVADRDAQGLPTRLALPGPIAGQRVQLYVPAPGGHGNLWAADVLPDGTLKSDGTRNDLLTKICPGTKIIASTDSTGCIMALSALTRPAEPGKVKHRAATSPNHARSADDISPHEILISGHCGRVLDVR